jgi:hypothetical protein
MKVLGCFCGLKNPFETEQTSKTKYVPERLNMTTASIIMTVMVVVFFLRELQ